MAETVIRILTDWAEVESFGAEAWNRLLPERPHRNFFMSFERLSCWWRHDSNCKVPHVMLFEEDGRVIALLPLALCARRKSGLSVRTVEFLGGSTMEFATLPVPESRPDLISLAMDHLLALRGVWDVLWLAELDAEDVATVWLLQEAERRGLAVDSHITALCPYLPLDRPFEELWSGLFDSKGRNARTRKTRAAEKTPGLEFHHWRPGIDLCATLEQIAALERISWKGQEAVGLFTGAAGAWNSDLIRTYADRGMCDLRWVTIEGQMVSYRVGFIWEKVYCDYNTAYHPEHAKLSLSSVLLLKNIEDLCAAGVRRIEFCRGIQRYKLEWATGLRENRLVRIYNCTARAKLMRGLATAKAAVKGGRSTERPSLPIPLKDPLPPWEG